MKHAKFHIYPLLLHRKNMGITSCSTYILSVISVVKIWIFFIKIQNMKHAKFQMSIFYYCKEKYWEYFVFDLHIFSYKFHNSYYNDLKYFIKTLKIQNLKHVNFHMSIFINAREKMQVALHLTYAHSHIISIFFTYTSVSW